MTSREERGLTIAATARIKQKSDSLWTVPAQTGVGTYLVNPDKKTCTCLDHQEGGQFCKHLYAVKIVIQREFEFNADGTETVTETVVTHSVKKTTYPQNWRAYNAAQAMEKERFLTLLHELCQAIPEPTETKLGRPRLSIRDAIFCACYKVYSMLSSRRFTSDLCDAQAKGFIRRVPHFNSVLNVFDNEETTAILTALVAKSAEPLATIETTFAIDSSGFSGCRFDQWFETKWKSAPPRSGRTWVKAHAVIGCVTNIVTAVKVLGRDSSDTAQFPTLVQATSERFSIKELCADKAYLSLANLQQVEDIGAKANAMKLSFNSRGH